MLIIFWRKDQTISLFLSSLWVFPLGRVHCGPSDLTPCETQHHQAHISNWAPTFILFSFFYIKLLVYSFGVGSQDSEVIVTATHWCARALKLAHSFRGSALDPLFLAVWWTLNKEVTSFESLLELEVLRIPSLLLVCYFLKSVSDLDFKNFDKNLQIKPFIFVFILIF